ncbi:YraN family protein [Fusibacter sp. 3D3]|uniref:YraN family protein n=1 Tax=Fusibacter sp. 3D3 TaxID=1048380 RepID=UPI0008534987|nr:YraN family protein [Fusibacter sp. 3D3]GAU78784.1 predicted endonuclease distantly related to archaeal Holliday junction resolvase [Fusibacter sp. 3D3]
MNKRLVGNKGEAIAIKWLLEHQFEMITQNYYTPYGEIDIIAKKEAVFYFVEVKYRRNLNYGSAREALTRQKISHLKKSVLHYITSQSVYLDYKVSFIGIYDMNGRLDIEWLENIFE